MSDPVHELCTQQHPGDFLSLGNVYVSTSSPYNAALVWNFELLAPEHSTATYLTLFLQSTFQETIFPFRS
jgi:hypothetical protein